ncbi:hypothetical protein AOL_s00054g137 [Orbilia oligospora ATCC 24927]|uniref:Uncharacterized protein n=1 Tax=Arthrobotrys oligospora (strain ATCC 24927 / CBS 115.81 / DSM 1491) TaxID=756982 RepID=G1X5J3_ARTOA|nr:hypothetical protein AOL_s00054g137 [Orbilia oligospora ATCC 24927]EGX51438.1 hypothetical protein AOL_s00054g137 [Orbilia oligospora ATCC 24927]
MPFDLPIRPYSKYTYGHKICALILWILLSHSCLAYYTLYLREGRGDWFDEELRRQVNGRLGRKLPGVCYKFKQIVGGAKAEYLVVYNPPGEPPASVIAFSRSQVCPEEKYSLSGRLILAVVLNPSQLEGAHLVNLTALGSDLAFHEASFVSLDPSIPKGDPNDLLANTTDDPKPAIYAWMKKGGKHLFERKRVYVPGNVYNIPDPSDKLKDVFQGGGLFYGYLRDLGERFILSKTSPQEFEKSQLVPDIASYEQQIQAYISNILSLGDTRDEAIAEGRLPPRPARKPKIRKNDGVIAYVRDLVGTNVLPKARLNELRGQDVTRQLQELEELMKPFDDPPGNRVSSNDNQELENESSESSDESLTESGSGTDGISSDIQGQETNSLENIDQVLENINQVPVQQDVENHNQVFIEAQEQGIGLRGDASEEPQQYNAGMLINEAEIDVLAESLQHNIGSRQSSIYSDDGPYSYGATSSGRGMDPRRRRIPLMEDSFSDPNPLVAGQSHQSQLNLQNVAGLDEDERFEVGPGRRRGSPQNSALQT